jgi:HD-GYP domain-containing protein (c-di-GMP phosphodiesterase class II)
MCRERGHVGRYGGDEFLAVLPGATGSEAAELARVVLAKLLTQGFMPNPQDGRVIPITLSFGIAAFPQDSGSRHELIAMADANLYSAKRSEGGIRQTTDSQRANKELKSEHSFAVLDGMVTAVDNKDSYTRRHSEDVAEFAIWIGEELGMSPNALRTLRIGALLHDVGKICVPDEILRKPGRLTSEEYEILKRHPRLGALIVGGVPGMEDIIDIVQFHHERWDGKGYPDGLEGEGIPAMGRLLAVADTFSAMTTDRPYRKGFNWTKALNEIHANIGTQFDPNMANAFLRAVLKRKSAGLIPPSAFVESKDSSASRPHSKAA